MDKVITIITSGEFWVWYAFAVGLVLSINLTVLAIETAAMKLSGRGKKRITKRELTLLVDDAVKKQMKKPRYEVRG